MAISKPARLLLALVILALTAAACSRSAQSHLDKANAYAAAGNDAAAVLELRRAVEKDASLAPARLQLAEIYLKQGNGPAALAEFIRAADLMPADIPVQLKAGSLLLLAGKADEAKARADKALAINPRSADALVLRANALAGLTDLDGALRQMQQALELAPTASRQMNLGALQAARGNVAEAEAAFRQAVATDPASVNARLALGQFLWSTGRGPEAEAAFKEGLAMEPANALANSALAAFYLRSGRETEAEPFFRALVDISGAPEARLALANYYLAVRRPADAITALKQLSTVPQFWALARARIAGIEHAEGRKDDAYRSIEEVIAKQPGLPAARIVRGRLLLDDGRMDEALADAEAAVKAAPESPEGHYLLGTVQLARRDLDASAKAFGEVLRLDPRSAAAQIQLANIELQRNALPAATQLAERAAAMQPGNLAAQLLLARSLIARGDLDRAQSIVTVLLERGPEEAIVQSLAGTLALAKGDRTGARAFFERALSLDERMLDPLSALVALDLQDGQPQQARARVEQRFAKAPNDSNVLALAGTTLAQTGDRVRGEAFLRRAIDADPANLSAYLRLGGLYVAEGKLDAAVAEFDKLAAQRRSEVGAATMAAIIVQTQGKEAEAQQRYERIVEQDPRAAVASNNLAWMLAARGEQLDRALQLAQAAKAQLPDNGDVNDTLGFVYIRKQLPSLAVPLLRLAVAAEPGNPGFQFHLGMALAQVGDKPGARLALERALAVGPGFEDAAEARRLLTSLD